MYHIVMQDRSLPIDPQLTEEQQAEQQVKFQSFLAELKQSLYDQVKEKYDNQAVVLSYQLYDAWFHPITTIKITDRSDNNVCFIYHRKEITEAYSLEISIIREIMNLITLSGETMKKPDYLMDVPPVYDGYEYRIFLSDGKDGYYIPCSNLGYAMRQKLSNAMVLIDLLNAIFSLLKVTGADSEFFRIR